jgi:hypothetical protein
VVAHCRGRETDEKRVTAEIYDAGDARQYDGDAKRTARQDPAIAAKKTLTSVPSQKTWRDENTVCLIFFFTFALFFSFFTKLNQTEA